MLHGALSRKESAFLKLSALSLHYLCIACIRLGIGAPAKQYRLRYGATAEVRKARPAFRQGTAKKGERVSYYIYDEKYAHRLVRAIE